MPTGYTHAIKDGIDFKQFVWSCARGMGALVMMRDLPSDAPIPERFEPSDYNRIAAEKARAELARLQGLTTEQASAEALAAYQRELKSQESAIAENNALRVKYEAMLKNVEQWTPPTEDHQGFKAFMSEQLRESIKFDCSNRYYEENKPVCKSTDSWLAETILKAQKDIDYHEKNQAEENARTESRNQWIKALRESLK